MQRSIVIGCPGAGKSTFARKLRDKTGLPLYYLDRMWHKSDRTTVTRAEFDAQLDAVLREERWIIDGNYSRTMEVRLAACDTVFFFDLPTGVCLEGALARVGVVREEMPWIETEPDEAFINEITGFPSKKPAIYELLRKYQAGRTVVIFLSRQDADTYIDNFTDS